MTKNNWTINFAFSRNAKISLSLSNKEEAIDAIYFNWKYFHNMFIPLNDKGAELILGFEALEEFTDTKKELVEEINHQIAIAIKKNKSNY